MMLFRRPLFILALALAAALLVSNLVQVALLTHLPAAKYPILNAPAPAAAPVPGVPTPPRLGWTYAGIQSQITRAAREYGQSAYWMGRVVYCESNDNPNVTNAWSGAAGVAQFMWPTFAYYSRQLWWQPGTWLSPYNPRAALRTMAYMWRMGQARQWSCSYIVGYLYGAGHVTPGHGAVPPGCRPPLFSSPNTCWAWLPNKGVMQPPTQRP